MFLENADEELILEKEESKKDRANREDYMLKVCLTCFSLQCIVILL